MTTCLNPAHFEKPDLENCSTCRMEHEEYLQRWFGKEGVNVFRRGMDSKRVLEELRKLK